ncbi:MAG: radical SAM family heme chaperone HemW [Pseudomonadota bacterium]
MRGGSAPSPVAAPPAALDEDWRYGGFGVYVHWPFCQAKCPYCDFNSHVWTHVDQLRWREAMLRELDAAHRRTPNRMVDTVFFGGGTPSLMPGDTVAAVIDRIRQLWGLAPDAEITLEANPTSVEAGRFRDYRDGGVNRISLGVQALRDRALTALGRMHTTVESRAAFEIARSIFDRVSCDLIYARMGQSPDEWRQELMTALQFDVDHASLYQLTIEPGTRFFELQERGRLSTPGQDDAAAMYEMTQEICARAGLPAYEISNHARPGAESRHNLIYWRYGDYAGVGPGAHGRLTTPRGRVATETLRDPAAWLSEVETKGEALLEPTPLTRREQAEEMMMMGLRLTEGVDLDRYAALSGAPLSATRIETLQADGYVAQEGRTLRATPKGRPVLNALLRDLLA